MTREEIMGLDADGIETRMAEIKGEIDNADAATLDALNEEMNAIEERKGVLRAEIEQRKANMKNVIEGSGKVIAELETEEERHIMTPMEVRATAEYRDAWLKHIAGQPMTEEEKRTMSTGITGTTPGTGTDVTNQSILVPTEIINNIWNLIGEKHPIINDVTTYRTGTVIELIQHTQGDGASMVAEGSAPTEEGNTFAKLVLAGKDFAKWVEFTYAMERMSLPALQSYIQNEISEALGNLIAADIVATIVAQTANTETGGITYATICKALGDLKGATNVVIYAPRSVIYTDFVAMVGTDGHPIFQLDPTGNAIGRILGCQIKEEDAVTSGCLFMDGKAVVTNVIQDIMVETDKDIKSHKTIHSGYARMETGVVIPKATAVLS